MSLKNKVIGAFIVLLFITIVSSLFISNNISDIKTNVKDLSNESFNGITVLLEADRDSYQSNVALSQIMQLKNNEKIDKLIKKGVNDNLLQVRQRFDKFKARLEKDLRSNKKEFLAFDEYYSLTKKHTEKIVLLVKNGNKTEARDLYFNNYLKDYSSMRDLIDFFTEATYKVADINKKNVDNLISLSLNTFVVITLLSIFITLVFVYLIGKTLNDSLLKLENGLLNFFRFLNKETKDVELLDTSSKDEISKMAAVINENIEKTRGIIHQDEEFIGNVSIIVNNVKDGNLKNKIDAQTSSESLIELKRIFNEMLEVLSSKVATDLNEVQKAMNEYKNYNFSYKIQNSKGNFVDALNEIANTVSSMLVLNKNNGLFLKTNSNELLQNVDKLSSASTQAAASIEQTAAALEEITSNMAGNTQNVVKMVQYANELTHSANTGEKLAADTTNSMEEINEQVSTINEAISVIDQISFQTNILSLNAAVEAATAGEAGKGFAVVAQEVRNLATRSGEAANEIKAIVENATSKANDGKVIANQMITGYEKLSSNISNTMELIKGIESSIKEQQTGIEQISNAVNSLDKQTQENATVASYSKDIAVKTESIAQEILSDVENKNFDGK